MTFLGDRLNILMADDNPEDLVLIDRILEAKEFPANFKTVGDGLELMQYLRNEGAFSDPIEHPWPDLILLDLNMPNMDGREALREIRSDPNLADVRIIVLSSSGEIDDFEAALDEGANFYVAKPIDINTFLSLLNSFLESAESDEASVESDIAEPVG